MKIQGIGVGLFLFILLTTGAIGQDISDQAIKQAVHNEITAYRDITAPDLEIKVNQGMVTLDGQVNNLLDKRKIENLALMIKGVKGVVNIIKVVPDIAAVSDQALRKHILSALAQDPAVELKDMDLLLDNGEVILKGSVQSWQERKLAENIVAGIQGVSAIDNQVQFIQQKNRPDQEISQEIKRMFDYNVQIDNGLVDIKVDNGWVSLSGVVGSAWEKQIAKELAWVSGVRQVNAEALIVTKWARDQEIRADKYVNKTNQELKNAIDLAFLYDPRVFSFPLEIEVDNGQATLSGRVDNIKAKKAAEEDAKNIVGIWEVKNEIKVSTSEMPPDSLIKNKLTQALYWDPYLERGEVNVTVLNGKVYLNGTVDNYYEKYHAEDIAGKVNGVLEVENNLGILDTYPLGYYADWGPEEPAVPVINSKRDEEIKEDIISQYKWSPFVDEDEVKVKVEDGKAILTGTVNTWETKRQAEKNAYEGGAIFVDNELEISLDVTE